MLVECPAGQDTDLDGDVGAVGRFNITGVSDVVLIDAMLSAAGLFATHSALCMNLD